jgi:hypothetical protein
MKKKQKIKCLEKLLEDLKKKKNFYPLCYIATKINYNLDEYFYIKDLIKQEKEKREKSGQEIYFMNEYFGKYLWASSDKKSRINFVNEMINKEKL